MIAEGQDTFKRQDSKMTPLGVLLRIGLIVAVVETLDVVAFAQIEDYLDSLGTDYGLPTAIFDAILLTVFSSPLIYFWVIKPYVSARDAAEGAERASKARYQNIMDSTNDAIVSIGVDARLASGNLAANQMFGYSVDELRGMPLLDLLPQCDFEAMKSALSVVGPERQLFQLEAQRKDGAVLTTEVSISYWDDDGGIVYTAVIRDVTAARKLTARLQEVQKLEAVSQLTGGVAHEFNNILTIITGNLSLISRQAKGDERILKRIGNAQRAASRGAKLIEQLLTFSRSQRLDTDALEANVVVKEVVAMLKFARSLGEAIQIETKLDARMDLIQADQVQLEQTLINLAMNAKSAMPGGGTLSLATANVDLDETVAHSFEVEAGPYTMLTVTDTGTGMSEETRLRAFEPFFTTKDIGEGTGLGLSTAYGFAKQSRGHIVAESSEGRGTTIRLYFPNVQSPGGAIYRPGHAVPAA